MKTKILSKKITGFTLIELLVTVAIIGILSSIAIYGLSSTREKAQDTSHLSTIRDYQLALEAYKSVNNQYPSSLMDLVPAFVGKAPESIFTYSLDTSGKKSYCLHVNGVISKPSSQPDMNCTSQQKTWVVCKGANISGLTTCPGIVSY